MSPYLGVPRLGAFVIPFFLSGFSARAINNSTFDRSTGLGRPFGLAGRMLGGCIPGVGGGRFALAGGGEVAPNGPETVLGVWV